MLQLDHVGIVVANLDQSADWWGQVLGVEPTWIQGETEVTPEAIGLPGRTNVRLRGASFAAGRDRFVELHEYLSPVGAPVTRESNDQGLGHLAFYCPTLIDLRTECRRLEDLGVTWCAPEPEEITVPPLEGVWWIYGTDPYDGVRIELTYRPLTLPTDEDS